MKDTCRIFIVEDDPWFAEMMKHHLSLNPDYTIHVYSNARDCLSNLHLRPDVIGVDFDLPDMKGDELLRRIKEHNKTIPIIVISGQENINVVVNFFKLGANDYIVKDENTRDLLWNAVLKIRENSSLKLEVEELKEQLGQKYSFENTIVGQSVAIKKVHSLIEKAVQSNINVSLSGETGTGKEVVAKAIHYNSERRRKPFIAVNMAAIPKELVESELFGYEKGAFTGANSRRAGKFEEAEGGTIFLDEIAELDLSLQSKILRVIQEREIVRLGSSTSVKFNARLITATHKDLADEVKKGQFREDLYYRIIGLPIELPPLRDRGNDILILARHFSKLFSKDNQLGEFSFSDEAIKKFLAYHYPGNIRELKATVDLACVMSNQHIIQAHDISFNNVKNNRVYTDAERTLREYTIEIITKFLKKYNNNVVEVAKRLDIGKSTIYNMIQKKELRNE
jgi:DNA-binding NtrC family response regulator